MLGWYTQKACGHLILDCEGSQGNAKRRFPDWLGATEAAKEHYLAAMNNRSTDCLLEGAKVLLVC
jgi:hypothetical protein